MSEVLTPDQITGYDKNGYIVLENQIPIDWLEKIRSEIAHFEIEAAGMIASNDRLDLADGFTSENPRLDNIQCVFRNHSRTDQYPIMKSKKA